MNTDNNKCETLNKVKLTGNILFSGIGAQERGFEDSGLFEIDVLTTSDICKETVLSYAAIHCGLTNEMVDNYKNYPTREEMAQHLTDIDLGYDPEKNKYYDWFKLAKKKSKDLERYWLACKLGNNLGNISKIEKLPYADFWTVSFCCQDISVAGKMKGLKPDSGTRSSLLWDNIKLLDKAKGNGTLPKYIMFENVKNLVSKTFINDFNDLIEVLEELGFNTYWKVINGKDCGIPQNRERVFVIAIRKDIDTREFTFPNPFDNGIRLKDLLENAVSEKYYISDDKVSKLLENLNSASFENKKDTEPIRLGNVYGEQFGTGYAGNVWDKNALCPTLMTMQGGGRQPHITTGTLSNKGENFDKETDIVNTLLARDYKGFGNQGMNGVINFTEKCLRVRKLTPKECWRLMGFKDLDCDLASAIGVADSHLYKQAGNSIITNCVKLLAEHLYKAQYDNTYECSDENFTRPQVD